MSRTHANLYSSRFFNALRQGASRSATVVVPLLLELLDPSKPRSVVDVGCGSGGWGAACMNHGITDVVGVDGDYVDPAVMELPLSHFVSHDLAQPLALGRQFDLAISLEVAEHLPPESSDTLVASLTGLAPLVLFSAAIPYQGGTSHLNEQWPDYWVQRFRARNYAAVDLLRVKLWDDDRVDWWYAQNTVLFVSVDHLSAYPALAGKTVDSVLALVHPKGYLDNVGLRRSIARMPSLVVSAVRRRIHARSTNSGGRSACR